MNIVELKYFLLIIIRNYLIIVNDYALYMP